ncbi:MAG: hypothetical protein AAB217_23495 [Chloroflexota bacterium]
MSKFKRYFASLFLLSALVLTGCGSGGGGGGGSTASNSGGGTGGGGGGGGGTTIACTGAGTGSIVGTWSFSPANNPANDLLVATFFANGTYMIADDGDPADPTPGQDGMERGTYTWNATTGAFTATPTVDTDGQRGLSHPPSNVCVKVNGDSLTYTDSGAVETVTRILDGAANDILGTWTIGDTTTADNLAVITFFSDGTYVDAEDNNNALSGPDGMERGTYTWNAGNHAFAIITVTANTNGDIGLADSPTCNDIQVSGNVMTITCVGKPPFTLNRISGGGGGGTTIACTGGGTGSIVGTWNFGSPTNDPNDLLVATFFTDGTYIMADDGDPVVDPTGQDGMERGTYTWDAATGAFSVTLPLAVDTDGQWGLSHPPSNVCVEITGNDLIYKDSGANEAVTRVLDGDATSIIGTWAAGNRAIPDELTVITFFSDGTYTMVDDSINNATGYDGMERGAYTWNAANGAFTNTTTVDTNGDTGLSDGSSSPCNEVLVTGNVMTLTCPGEPNPSTFNRIP